MHCINLQKRFGRRFKVRYAEDYFAQYGPNAQTEDPWYMEIPCENGSIAPWGGFELVACTKTAGPVANRLKAIPFTRVAQDGDDGANVVFGVEHFDVVAKLMKPRRRRRLSEAARRWLADAGAKTRFQPGTRGPHTARTCVPRPQPDSKGRREPTTPFRPLNYTHA